MHSAKILAETEMNQHSSKILATIAFQIPVHLQTQTHMQHHKHMQHHFILSTSSLSRVPPLFHLISTIDSFKLSG